MITVEFPLDPDTFIDHWGNRYYIITTEFRDCVCEWLTERGIEYSFDGPETKRPLLTFKKESDYLLFKLTWEEIS
jgi:hypothetical protein